MAALAAGMPAYTAVCRITSAISASLKPVAQPGADVHRQLAFLTQGGEQGDRQAGAGATVEDAVARPHADPTPSR